MELFRYLFRFVYRIKWWLLIFPAIITIVVIYKTRNLPRSYEVKTTIYTGVMSGFNITDDGTVHNINVVNNTIDNLINVITARSTLRRVSMRLFAQHMMHGDSAKDNNFIQAKNYNHLMSITPQKVKELIDKKSEEETVARLFKFADSSTDNFLYGLFNWFPPYYSYHSLSQINVKRLGNSDMLEIKYTADDPGVAYNTLILLNEEFMKQYENLQFGETNKVIKFFEDELLKTGQKLKVSEDSLTGYNIQKKIINYDEQTKHLAALSRDFQLQLEEIFLQYNSSEAQVRELEKRIGENVQLIRNNSRFISYLNQVSEYSTQIAKIEAFKNDSVDSGEKELKFYRDQLNNAEDNFKVFSDSMLINKNTKEGYPKIDLIGQWIEESIRFEEAKAKLEVMERWQNELDDEYIYYSPIGSTIKRKEREINFTEASYLAILSSLNTARLRQKSLQMNSATLRVLNPPNFPLSSASTKRKIKVVTAFMGSFIFILGYFILIELLDRTLRNKIRTERITSGKVIGAFPGRRGYRYRGYSKQVDLIAAKALGNLLLRYSTQNSGLIINIISIEKGEGKTYLTEKIANYYTTLGLHVRSLSWQSDFVPASGDYLLAKKFTDFIEKIGEQITLIEYPPLQELSVPSSLLQQAHVNLLIVCSNRVWRDTDKILFQSLQEESQNVPVLIVLNKTKREETEYFTGLLPPRTRRRKLLYRFLQLGLTSSE